MPDMARPGVKNTRGAKSAGNSASEFAPNLDVLAEQCGIDRRTITNARKRFAHDAPKKRPDGRYHISNYRDWLARHGVLGRRKDAEMEGERAIRLELLKLDLDKKKFDFQKAKEQMLPLSQYQFALQEMLASLLGKLNAFSARVNPLLEGLDFHDRAAKLEEEIEIVKRAIYAADFLPSPATGVE